MSNRGIAAVLGLAATAGVIALVAWPDDAKAAELPKAPPVPPPQPTNDDIIEAANNAEAAQLLRVWQEASELALEACKQSTEYQDEWWRLQDRIDAGEAFSGDIENQRIIERAWTNAQARCERLNAESIEAMHDYENAVGGTYTTGRRSRR